MNPTINNRVFLFIDECKNLKKVNANGKIENFTVIGCLCVPANEIIEAEKRFMISRINNCIWGEVKSSSISGDYIEKYKNLVVEYIGDSFNDNKITYHSRAYPFLDKKIRVANHKDAGNTKDTLFKDESYRLIRSVIFKCLNAGMNNIYIVADGYGGNKGRDDYRNIRIELNNDPRFNGGVNIVRCVVGNSISCGALQITDLITGIVARKYYDNSTITEGVDAVHEELIRINGGLDLIRTTKFFPKLYSSKFHHYIMRVYS